MVRGFSFRHFTGELLWFGVGRDVLGLFTFSGGLHKVRRRQEERGRRREGGGFIRIYTACRAIYNLGLDAYISRCRCLHEVEPH